MLARTLLLRIGLAIGPAVVSAQSFDVVIRGGRLIDGRGQPAFAGDVAIRDGRIVAVGTAQGSGRTEIDARGAVVAPGFIDVHTHSEDVAELPVAENFIRMGVTTIVTGNCGGSKLNVGEFFEKVSRTGVTLNVATLIGHNTVRGQVMGGSFRRPPTDAELSRMCDLVDQAMKSGAVGLSTGLIYLPGTFATTEEIVALAKVASRHGGIYVSHMRDEQAKIFESLAELTRIGREARIPAHVSHIKLLSPVSWGRADEVVAFLERARSEGVITHDQYMYTASSTGISSRIPDWIREGGRVRFRERLADASEKARCVAEMKATLKANKEKDYGYAVIANFAADPSLNGKTIAEAAKRVRGSDSLDDQIELMLDIQLRGDAQGVFHGMSEEDLQKFLVQPLTMIASDSGIRKFGEGVPHPRGYGNNARVLSRYVRELKLLGLEEAVRKMTSLPAQTFRLGNRVALAPGFVADIVIFDPGKVDSPATFDDPHHYATGFSDVIVNGVPVIRAGELTAARPGQPVKRAE